MHIFTITSIFLSIVQSTTQQRSVTIFTILNSVLLITDFCLSATSLCASCFSLFSFPSPAWERREELSLALSVSSFKTLLQMDF